MIIHLLRYLAVFFMATGVIKLIFALYLRSQEK